MHRKKIYRFDSYRKLLKFIRKHWKKLDIYREKSPSGRYSYDVSNFNYEVFIKNPKELEVIKLGAVDKEEFSIILSIFKKCLGRLVIYCNWPALFLGYSDLGYSDTYYGGIYWKLQRIEDNTVVYASVLDPEANVIPVEISFN